MAGFETLIEKDWIAYGHSFYKYFIERKEFCPLFLEFLDGVFQLMCQFPTFFEFNEKLLVDIADHLLFAVYGNFLEDFVKSRKNFPSLWQYIRENSNQYLNGKYETGQDEVLLPSASIKVLRYWTAYYARESVRPKTTNLEEKK
jgi:hypothetical protein